MRKIYLLSFSFLFLLTACTQTVDMPTDEEVSKVKQYSKITSTTKPVIDPVHGEQVGFWYGALTGVEGTNANGIGLLRSYKDGASSVTVNLNILPVEKPAFFSVKLLNDATKSTIEIGQLNSIVGDARHSLVVETKEDTSNSHHVVIYAHKSADDVGALVAEGTLKATATPAR